jgi:hypothetical protein
MNPVQTVKLTRLPDPYVEDGESNHHRRGELTQNS